MNVRELNAAFLSDTGANRLFLDCEKIKQMIVTFSQADFPKDVKLWKSMETIVNKTFDGIYYFLLIFQESDNCL